MSRVKFNCDNCGNESYIKTSHYCRKKRHFCSMKCYADFRKDKMPFPDKSFKMVVYDPPHLTSGSEKSVINKKYGILNKETWKEDIVAGFNECWRVLDDNGVLIFKWNNANKSATELIKAFPVDPLFGDFTGKTGKTIWMTFMKSVKVDV